MILLSIDPSTNATGWAVMSATPNRVNASGVFHPSKAKSAPHAHCQIASHVRTLIQTYLVDCVIVETPDARNYGRKRKAGDLITYGAAVGSVTAAAHLSNVTVERAKVEQWKGTRSKMQTIIGIQGIPGAANVSDDNEADAIGLGDWFLRVGRHAAKSRSA